MHRDLKPTPYDEIFWIFALWRALHGGAPTLSDVAAAVIANLAQFLPAREDSFGLLPLPHSPAVAPEISDDSEEANVMDVVPGHTSSQEEIFCDDPREFSIHHYYFNCNGVFYRLDRPVLACLPAAA